MFEVFQNRIKMGVVLLEVWSLLETENWHSFGFFPEKSVPAFLI